MNNINMNWQQEDLTVYALNEQGDNDFSFCVQGNGYSGYDPKKLVKVASMALAAPDMYRALRDAAGELGYEADSGLGDGYYTVNLTQAEVDAIRAALAKAKGEQP